MEYLEEVAVNCARGIADKRIPLTKEKGVMQSMRPYYFYFLFFLLSLYQIESSNLIG